MCRVVEALVVCCSEQCVAEPSENRLLLLRLTPKPEPVFLLCEQANKMSYQNDGSFLGMPIIVTCPVMCSDLAHTSYKHRLWLTCTASREVMESRAERLAPCKDRLATGHAETVSVHGGYDGSTLLGHERIRMSEGTQRIDGDWTCCAAGECVNDICDYRAAAILFSISTQAPNAESDISDVQEGGYTDMSENETEHETENKDEATIVVRGHCGGCISCGFGQQSDS
ncbi:D-aminopeptidase [Colletotrichum higginsianum IMI 349063]|uniref:D-aminopeptidase n=2 Tax=Colletotrichum higginsianum TaxID=80884 RepID=A0A1B7YCF2_COLHI|nr:D-aminopeptidase [Colletotrichum higginsianum IMI 349063]OBR09772.1 D-aminopeptidase [Colletotrichum higginsianum IMI 349063]TID06167.1 hypothetical protein CH35J_001615 [Colletotrichum higginsianum]GJD03208.1 D-aminopeptidase [Colletotrichum higginsianum]